MVTVQLCNLLFNGFHGVHEEEQILGNEYKVDASLQFQETTGVISHIHDTVNYVAIYNIIRARMAVPTPLLETIIMEIGNAVHAAYPHLKSINISLKKLHPPIEGIQGEVGVAWHKEF